MRCVAAGANKIRRITTSLPVAIVPMLKTSLQCVTMRSRAASVKVEGLRVEGSGLLAYHTAPPCRGLA